MKVTAQVYHSNEIRHYDPEIIASIVGVRHRGGNHMKIHFNDGREPVYCANIAFEEQSEEAVNDVD